MQYLSFDKVANQIILQGGADLPKPWRRRWLNRIRRLHLKTAHLLRQSDGSTSYPGMLHRDIDQVLVLKPKLLGR